MRGMKKNIYTIVLIIILGLIFGTAHIDSCIGKRTEPRLILNVKRIYQTETVQIEEPVKAIEPVQIEVIEKEYRDPDIPEEIQEAAIKYGEEYNIQPEFLEALAWRESRYTPDAVSSDGSCIGLCQINPKWHKERMERTGKDDLYQVDDNMNIAADYLAELFKEYPGDPEIVLMIYNGDHSYKKGHISKYAQDIVNKSQELEKKHGK